MARGRGSAAPLLSTWALLQISAPAADLLSRILVEDPAVVRRACYTTPVPAQHASRALRTASCQASSYMRCCGVQRASLEEIKRHPWVQQGLPQGALDMSGACVCSACWQAVCKQVH